MLKINEIISKEWHKASRLEQKINKAEIEASLHQWAILIGCSEKPEVNFIETRKEFRQANKIITTIRNNINVSKNISDKITLSKKTYSIFKKSHDLIRESSQYRTVRLDRIVNFVYRESNLKTIKAWNNLAYIAPFAFCNDLWIPLFRTFCAGGLLVNFIENIVFVVCIPSIKFDDEDRYHSIDSEAIRFLDKNYYFIRNVKLDEYIIREPEKITINDIDSEMNTEVRRVMIDRYKLGQEINGAAAYLKDSGATRIDYDESYGTLYYKDHNVSNRMTWWGWRDEPIVMLEVVNSTPEPDGTFKHYWLRVPPEMKTAKEAAAWTFGIEPEKYKPIIET